MKKVFPALAFFISKIYCPIKQGGVGINTRLRESVFSVIQSNTDYDTNYSIIVGIEWFICN